MKATSCFFCGDPDKGLANNPKEYYRPCAACNAMMSLGTTLLGYVRTPNGHPPIATKKGAPSLYPTGNWLVLGKGVPEMLLAPEVASKMVLSKRNIVEDSLVTGIRELARHEYTLISMEDAERIRAQIDKTDKTGGDRNEP